ncbi:hypothetical protein [Sphingobacterium tabacisoli]|uniref:TetR/AcrR family transcriptional regulator n=1 Tax=Sphingobacterium tabacisoli TaxID=2044855 RepID=A0ABW5L670_9SPHI|nr:hypothetical protein [Sphingobacterium tabacisoli]
MSKEADFIRNALVESKAYVLDVGFKSLKLEELLLRIACSKTKFYAYFGTVNGLLIMVLKEEYRQMSLFIRSSMNEELRKDLCTHNIIKIRDMFLDKSILLTRYFNERNIMNQRFFALKKAVSNFESDVFNDCLKRC